MTSNAGLHTARRQSGIARAFRNSIVAIAKFDTLAIVRQIVGELRYVSLSHILEATGRTIKQQEQQ